MISHAAYLLNVCAITIQKVLYLASLVGQLIVVTTTSLFALLLKTLENIYVFFQVLYEDNISVFSDEFPASINNLFTTALYQLNLLVNGTLCVGKTICLQLNGVFESIKWFLLFIKTLTLGVIFVVKDLLIYFGNFVWFVVTYLPINLSKCIYSSTKYVFVSGFENVSIVFNTFSNIMSLLTEVPLESLIGLMCAILIINTVVQFRTQILIQTRLVIRIIESKIIFTFYTIYNYFFYPEVRIISSLTNNHQINERNVNSTPDTYDTDDGDTLCVVCKMRPKCVLTLPCRHICLCTECNRQLYSYQRNCPICRTFIYHSVTVYL